MDKNQHIIFYVGKWSVGGIERVTCTLANAFCRRGYKVSIAIAKLRGRQLLDTIDSNVTVCEVNRHEKKSREAFSNLVNECENTTIINQRGDNVNTARFLKTVIKECSNNPKVISCWHSAPDALFRVCKSRIAKFFKRLSFLRRIRTVWKMSDAFVLLSERFIPITQNLAFLPKENNKLFSIPNPLPEFSAVTNHEKENVILYCGRLEEDPKRVSRVIAIWEKLHVKLPDWRLEIIGDGPDRKHYEELASSLPRIKFLGFQDPQSFYSRAKILLLTSDYEGFPMSLAESMSFGCVPVVLGSFLSVHDIINDGVNGFVLPEPFDVETFSECMKSLAGNKLMLQSMSAEALQTREIFSADSVVEKWRGIKNEHK